jgi:hypothetical protein
MAGENIKFTGNQINMVVKDGYFYTFDYVVDNLLQKTDDGNTAFSYPLDTLISLGVLDSESDDIYFWSLQNTTTGVVYIRRWKIENYVCKLQQTFNLINDAFHYYNADAFSLAHYHTTFSSPVSSGSGTIYLAKYSDDTTLMGFTTTSGVGLTLHLGPNSSGYEEDVVVSGVVASGVVLTTNTQYAYATSATVNFYTHIWLFNNRNGTDASTGALYKLDAYTGAYLTKYVGGAYQSVTATTFYNVDSFTDYGPVDTLAYIKGTNMLFINVGAAGATLPYYGSMVLENLDNNKTAVLTVYDLSMDDQNVYRLQIRQDGASGDWTIGPYNYQLSTLDHFVSSISLAAYPAIIAANGISSADIVATVRDQFLLPITARLVTFSDDNPTGVVIPTTQSTNAEGIAQVSYVSGTSAATVKITAVVEQT